jgi:Fe2+ or Zn2+ uptake regulation protein
VAIPAAEQILEQLRAHGGRITTVRRAVITALVTAEDHHVTADDLAAAVQVEHPDVHRSTVYRTLDALEQLGVVDHVHLGHGRAVYHLTDNPHQHLVCECCGKVIQVPDETFDDLAAAIQAQYHFAIRPHHFAVLGRCADCDGRTVAAPTNRIAMDAHEHNEEHAHAH